MERSERQRHILSPDRLAVPILMYHSISSVAGPHFRPCVVHPARFAAQMAYLAERGYTPLTVTELVHARAGAGLGLPARPVVLTFDDGYADFYTQALPVLQAHGFRATLYVATAFIGGTSRWSRAAGESQRPMLSWRQLAELPGAGIEVGAHSHVHPELDVLPVAEARAEIVGSKALLEERLGRAVASFAYPFGYHDRVVRELVQAAGFSSACAVTPRLSPAGDQRFALARVMVLDSPNLATFAARLAGRGITLLPRDPLRPWLQDVMRRSTGRLRRRLRMNRESHSLNAEVANDRP